MMPWHPHTPNSCQGGPLGTVESVLVLAAQTMAKDLVMTCPSSGSLGSIPVSLPD